MSLLRRERLNLRNRALIILHSVAVIVEFSKYSHDAALLLINQIQIERDPLQELLRVLVHIVLVALCIQRSSLNGKGPLRVSLLMRRLWLHRLQGGDGFLTLKWAEEERHGL
jgi:hypothetical protein